MAVSDLADLVLSSSSIKIYPTLYPLTRFLHFSRIDLWFKKNVFVLNLDTTKE